MIDRKKVEHFRNLIQNELLGLEQVGKEEGFTIRLGNATYSNSNVTFKLELSTVNEDGSVNTKEATDFKNYASMYGLNPNDLGRTFEHIGDVYTVVGCKPRSRKFPILCKNSQGKVYKFNEATIKMYLNG